jgi:hypothetical protein
MCKKFSLINLIEYATGISKIEKMTKIRPGIAEIQAETCGRRFFAHECCRGYTLYDRGKGRLAAARKKKNNVCLVLCRNYSNSKDFVKGCSGEEIVNYFTPKMKKFGVKPNI